MPIYNYECEKGHMFEVEHSIKADPVKRCTWPDQINKDKKCRAKVKRLISSTSFSLKGKGWAKDGYSK